MQVVIFVGLPASGKTTFYRERFAATHVHVSKDNFPNHRRPSKRQEREIRAALDSNQSVVVDNTNASTDDRATIIQLAREYGAEVVGYFFESDVDACKARNDNRDGKALVSNVGFFATAKRYQVPEAEEGFDKVFDVRLSDHGFELEKR